MPVREEKRERREDSRETVRAAREGGARDESERGRATAAAMRCAASEWIRAHGGCLWLTEATKGAAGRERPGVGASGRGSRGTRMGQPAAREARHPPEGGGEPAEPKHPSRRRKGKQE